MCAAGAAAAAADKKRGEKNGERGMGGRGWEESNRERKIEKEKRSRFMVVVDGAGNAL